MNIEESKVVKFLKENNIEYKPSEVETDGTFDVIEFTLPANISAFICLSENNVSLNSVSTLRGEENIIKFFEILLEDRATYPPHTI